MEYILCISPIAALVALVLISQVPRARLAVCVFCFVMGVPTAYAAYIINAGPLPENIGSVFLVIFGWLCLGATLIQWLVAASALKALVRAHKKPAQTLRSDAENASEGRRGV